MTIEETIQEKLNGYFVVKSIESVNHKPHRFVLGPQHIKMCSEYYGGMLGDACIADRRFPCCAQSGCALSYAEHTSDKVLFLSLVRNLTNEEGQEKIKSIVDDMMADKIDGVAFVETPEKYRFTTKTDNNDNRT